MARKKIEVHYCDFCSQPIHKQRHILMILTEHDLEKVKYGRKVERKEKEICDKCKEIIEELFVLRKNNLKKIVNMIEGTFKLAAKKPKRKKTK